MNAARSLALAVAPVAHDLVLCGKQAGDDEGGIVAGALAELLGLPDFSCVVDLRWDAAASQFRFQRTTEAGQETWSSPLRASWAFSRRGTTRARPNFRRS